MAYSLLRVASLLLAGAEQVQAEPWWAPEGVPSVTRRRRECTKVFGISGSLHPEPQVPKNRAARKAVQQNPNEAYAEAA